MGGTEAILERGLDVRVGKGKAAIQAAKAKGKQSRESTPKGTPKGGKGKSREKGKVAEAKGGKKGKAPLTDDEAEAKKVEALREQIASLEDAAKAAAKTLRAAEKERSVSEEMLRERIADLESELESSGVAAEEEIARLKTESAEIAAKLEETERRARDAEESYADALRVAAEEKDALEIEVGRLRLRAAELEDQLAERVRV